jgi:hypothetical protein
VDETEGLERAQGIPHHGPADTQVLGERPLGGDPIARAELPLGDQGAELLGDPDVQIRPRWRRQGQG